MFVQLHSPDPPSHVNPLHPAETRWCCWEWCCCFQHDDLAAFVVLSDVLPSREGDYMGPGTTPTFYLCCLHLEIYLKVWISIWMEDRNLSEHFSFIVSFFKFWLSFLCPRNSPRKYNMKKKKIYASELCLKTKYYWSTCTFYPTMLSWYFGLELKRYMFLVSPALPMHFNLRATCPNSLCWNSAKYHPSLRLWLEFPSLFFHFSGIDHHVLGG